jgi:outer membrane usher protein
MLAAHSCATRAAPVPGEKLALQLQVTLNARDTGMIAAFEREANGKLSSTRAELAEVGVQAPEGDPQQQVRLDDIPGLTYVYDERSQSIRIEVGAEGRAHRLYEAARGAPTAVAPQRDFGASFNYDLYTSTMRAYGGRNFTFQGASATLEGRLLTPAGTLSQTGIAGSTMTAQNNLLRLDSTWTWSDPETMVAWRLGDTISSGLPWTRPIRMGGAQVQRNFALRADLVTLPLPNISGSAAAPTTVDVYVNNVKTYSQQVQEGPYRISNLPVVGAGTAQVVVYDAAGRPVEQTLPFITSPLMLRPGFTDYSVEAGAPRQFYGVLSNAYDASAVASASLRRGLTEWLTLESHGEFTPGFYNGGAGAVVNVLSRAILNVAASASHGKSGAGGQIYGSLESRIGPVSLSLMGQYALVRYDDLASYTASTTPYLAGASLASGGGFSILGLIDSVRPPKEMATFSIGAPLPFDKSSLGLAMTHSLSFSGQRSEIASLSWTRGGPLNSSIFITAFADVGQRREFGLFAGVSVPLGKKTSASVSGSLSGAERSGGFQAARNINPDAGAWGWSLNDQERQGGSPYRLAQAGYRSDYGEVRAGVGQAGRDLTGSLELRGAFTTMGGSVFASNWIDDGFAVVNAGAPHVKVYADNRYIGESGSSGLLLAPQLRSWQRNEISIDPGALPLDSDAATTRKLVSPGDRGGVFVDFGVKTDVRGAVVILADAYGALLPAGSAGIMEGSNEGFVVGYDGRAYLTRLGAKNRVSVNIGLSECHAEFAYAPESAAQPTIGPVPCR